MYFYMDFSYFNKLTALKSPLNDIVDLINSWDEQVCNNCRFTGKVNLSILLFYSYLCGLNLFKR